MTLQKLFHKTETKNTFQLILQSQYNPNTQHQNLTDTVKKEIQTSMNVDANIYRKRLANGVQQFTERLTSLEQVGFIPANARLA